eukprot:5452645-Amphidinium_carterae.1
MSTDPAQLVDCADFVNATLIGKAGRAALAELRHHQHRCPHDAAISPAVVHGLQWLLALLQLAPFRMLQLRQSSQPWLLYTDGSAESADSCKRLALGSFHSYGSAQIFLVGTYQSLLVLIAPLQFPCPLFKPGFQGNK